MFYKLRSAPFTVPEYHLNISEKKKLPKAGSVSVLAMKLENSSALLKKASWILRFNLSRRNRSMSLVWKAAFKAASSSNFHGMHYPVGLLKGDAIILVQFSDNKRQLFFFPFLAAIMTIV